MINEKSREAVEKSCFGEIFVKPLSNYSFANIPTTVYNCFTGKHSNGLPVDVFGKLPKKYQKVVVLFIDAFGWQFFWPNRNKYPFLKRFVQKGTVSKLTAQFPSTTAAEVTTMYTGEPVGEHGIYEWFYYEPEADLVIAPFLFSQAGIKERENLRTLNIHPEKIYPTTNLFQKLKTIGTNSRVYNSASYYPSTYNEVIAKNSTLTTFNTLSEALFKLSNDINNDSTPTYYYWYYDKVDSMAHAYGPDSQIVAAEIDTTLIALERILYKKIQNKNDTLIMLVADHGQKTIDINNPYYINIEIPEIIPFLQKNKKGELLTPAGSCPDYFLYIKEDKLDIAKKILEQKLINIAKVYLTKDLINQNFFGPKISPIFKKRLGNLVIIPFNNQGVWWYEKDKFVIHHAGQHGGLSKLEIEIPLLLLNT